MKQSKGARTITFTVSLTHFQGSRKVAVSVKPEPKEIEVTDWAMGAAAMVDALIQITGMESDMLMSLLKRAMATGLPTEIL